MGAATLIRSPKVAANIDATNLLRNLAHRPFRVSAQREGR